MSRFITGFLVVMAICVLASAASAVTVFFDDFNDDSGILEGETSVTGQVWETNVYLSDDLGVSTTYGQSSIGAGATGGGGDNHIHLAAPVNSGTFILSADLMRTNAVNNGDGVDVRFGVYNTIDMVWVTWVNGDLRFDTPAAWSIPNHIWTDVVPTGMSTGNLHFDLTVDMDGQTGSVSWYDIDDPGDGTTSGNVDLGSWEWTPTDLNWDTLILMAASQHGGQSMGFDNVKLESISAYLLGDANLDTVVSADDYASVQANFGNTGAAGGGLLGDANHDGLVSADDYASVQANFGNTAGSGMSAAPEPVTIALLGLGGLVGLVRKRR